MQNDITISWYRCLSEMCDGSCYLVENDVPEVECIVCGKVAEFVRIAEYGDYTVENGILSYDNETLLGTISHRRALDDSDLRDYVK